LHHPETIVRHGTPTKVLCNKDPLTLKQGAYMAKIFPKSKWLFMMRDGRAVIHSVVTRKVSIGIFCVIEFF
jgi:protein-tyrosine sulfotransferase